MDNFGKIKLKYVAYSYASAQKQSEVFECGKYEVYGASGLVGYLNTYGADTEYIGIVKDGAGVGRAQIYKPYTSLLGTMAYIVPIDIKATNINFLKYSIDALDLGNTAGDRATIPHIYFSKYGNEYISSYPIMQQEKIANYLDEKCGKIDELIANQQGQIEKLKEYKQLVITEAVTKGLDKSAPLKDSGIEWISNIPDGWSIQKVLYQLKMPVTDGPHTTPGLFDSGVAFVSAEAVSCGNGGIDFNHIRGYISEEFYQECCLKYIPEIDDVYMIKSGATTGRVSIVTTLEPKFTIWSPLAVMRANKDKMLPKFLYYAVQSTHFQRQVALGWSYGTQQNLGMRTLEQLQLLVPSLEEQRCIVEYLDSNLIKIDKLIAIKQEKIEKLQEYKKSLIYEYVTGKKEVV